MPEPETPLAEGSGAGGVLRPVLGLTTAAAVVVGAVIGSGVFLAPRTVVENVGGALGLILILWIGCGLINLCGALTLAELAAMFPHAGGTYVYLREAYGRTCAFTWAWAEFWVMRSGSIAALAVAMTLSLLALLDLGGYELTEQEKSWLQKSVAIGAIAVLTGINILGAKWGGAVQTVTTAIKVLFVAFLAVLPFLALRDVDLSNTPLWPTESSWQLLTGIGGALALIMFAYDGWGNVTVVAEEIRNPQRNLPLALGGGVLLLIVLYTGANLAYHVTLTPDEIKEAVVPAVTAAERLLPNVGAKLTLSMMMVSVFGALNANILAGPRVVFAASRDVQALKFFRRIDPRFGTPAVAIAVVSTWSVVLILLGDLTPDPEKPLYEILVDYVIFGGSVFYLMAVVAVFVFRRRLPDAARPYRTWGYPIVPGLFVAFYLFLLATMAWSNPLESAVALAVMASGAGVYFVLKVLKRA